MWTLKSPPWISFHLIGRRGKIEDKLSFHWWNMIGPDPGVMELKISFQSIMNMIIEDKLLLMKYDRIEYIIGRIIFWGRWAPN